MQVMEESLTFTEMLGQSKQPAKKGIAASTKKVSSDFFSDFDIDEEEELRQQEAAAAELARQQAASRKDEPKAPSGRLGYSEEAKPKASAQQPRAPARREEDSPKAPYVVRLCRFFHSRLCSVPLTGTICSMTRRKPAHSPAKQLEECWRKKSSVEEIEVAMRIIAAPLKTALRRAGAHETSTALMQVRMTVGVALKPAAKSPSEMAVGEAEMTGGAEVVAETAPETAAGVHLLVRVVMTETALAAGTRPMTDPTTEGVTEIGARRRPLPHHEKPSPLKSDFRPLPQSLRPSSLVKILLPQRTPKKTDVLPNFRAPEPSLLQTFTSGTRLECALAVAMMELVSWSVASLKRQRMISPT